MQEQLTEARNESGTLAEEADRAKAAELELTEASIADSSCEKINFQKLEVSKSRVSELDAELKEVTRRKDELELDLEKFEDLNGRMFNDMTHLKSEFAKKEEERLNTIRELNDMKRYLAIFKNASHLSISGTKSLLWMKSNQWSLKLKPSSIRWSKIRARSRRRTMKRPKSRLS